MQFKMPLNLKPPNFVYEEPNKFFAQFKRFCILSGLETVMARELLLYVIGECPKADWLAARLEAELQGEDVKEMLEFAERYVLKLLQPEVLKTHVLQSMEGRKLREEETPREYVESLRSQLKQVLPDLSEESLTRLLIVQAVKGVPPSWASKLGDEDFTSVDQLVQHMTLLKVSTKSLAQATPARRVYERTCYKCRKPGHLAKNCYSSDDAQKCGKCTLRGHSEENCRTKCRKCHKTGHIAKNCVSTTSRRVTVGKTMTLEVELNGHHLKGVLDCGSERTLVSEATAREVGLKRQPSRVRVVGAGQESLKVHGCASCDVTVSDSGGTVSLEVLIVECGDKVLLGTDFLRAAEIRIDFASGEVTCFGVPISQAPVTVCRCVTEDGLDLEEEMQETDYLHESLQESKTCKNQQESQVKLGHLTQEKEEQVLQVLKKYDVFTREGMELGRVDLIEHNIELSERPRTKKVYPVPPALREKVDKQVQDMLKKGVIRECQSPYASPILLVKKKGTDDYRFCTDFRELNRCTVKDCFPLPRVESLLASVGTDMCWFSQLDQTAAYWQVKLAEDAQLKTAFLTEQGQYCYQTLAFGMCNGPATYQRLMTKIFKDLLHKSVVIYLDDTLLFSRTFSEHLKLLEEVCSRLESYGIRLNPRKCSFAQKEVKFLAHIISEGCIRPAESNVEAISKYKKPTTKTEVLRFLGMVGYFRHLIPRFSVRAAPLTDLTRGEQMKWTEEADVAFRDLCEAISSHPVVRPADSSLPFRVTTDACARGWGATLSQVTASEEYVVAYASGKWTSAEEKYPTTQQELLAVIRAVHRFRYFVTGTKFTVVTDHQALKWLWGLQEPSGRLARWIMYLSQFDLHIEHRPGACIPHADALSREAIEAPVRYTAADEAEGAAGGEDVEGPGERQRSDEDVRLQEDAPQAGTRDGVAERATRDGFGLPTELQQATEADPVLSAVKHCLRTGELTHDGLGPSGVYYLRDRDNLFVRDGLVYRQSCQDREPQILVPESMQERVIKLSHDLPMSAHFGVKRTVHQLTRRYYWYNLKASVRDYCRRCLSCARVKRPNRPTREGVGCVPVLGEPFAQWSADILGPLPRTEAGNVYILVVSDLFTKWVETYCIPDQKATTVADCFVDLISRFGVPKSILTDRGTNFESALVKRICEMLGISKVRCTAAHPQTDGQTERFNRTLCDSLTHYVNANQTDWDRWVGVCVSAFRFSQHSTTGYSPFELTHGVEPRVPVVSEIVDDSQELTCSTYQEYVNGLRRRLATDRSRALSSLENRQQQSMVPGSSDIQLHDQVMLKVQAVKRGRTKKLSDRFTGPFVVVKVMRPDYVIKRGRKQLFVHGSNLKKVDSSVRDDVQTDVSVRVPVADVSVHSAEVADEPLRPLFADDVRGSPADVAADAADVASDASVCSDSESDGEPVRRESHVAPAPIPVTRSGRQVRRPTRLDL